jgi:sn-1 stearoyl-lipid 9-desaturase
MSDDGCRVNSLVETPDASPVAGRVVWDPVHSLWHGGMLAAAAILVPAYASWSGAAVFVVLTGGSLLLGHSVGFHRRLIHRSFACPLWLERVLVWIGTCVGMGGPLWMIRTHDTRDWAQRHADCHAYLAHRGGMLRDYWWQIHCRLVLERPPRFDFGRAGADRFYRFLETTWMAQQLPLALLLFGFGGWGWVGWGVCLRVTVSVTGHWFIGHLAHTAGPQSWLVKGAGVQAHDVPWAAIPTMGEAWHNNHHAYPGSARIGIEPGQSDWGFVFIRVLERAGLAWDVVLPGHLDRAAALRRAAAAEPGLGAAGVAEGIAQ